MARKPETNFRQKVIRELRLLDNTVIFSVQQKAIRGTPDLLICCNSLFVAMELKTDEGECSALQEKTLNDVSKAKGVSLVARPHNWDKVYKMLMEISVQNIDLIDILDKSH